MLKRISKSPFLIYAFLWLALLQGASACSKVNEQNHSPLVHTPTPSMATIHIPTSTPNPTPTIDFTSRTLKQDTLRPTPTPDPIRPLPDLRNWNITYRVQAKDDLMTIARQYTVGVQQILDANGRDYSNTLKEGQTLIIPSPMLESPGPNLKILPDSELVNGPSTATQRSFNQSISPQSQLIDYVEEIHGEILDGPTILQRVAEKYSINPNVLLALFEFQCNQSEDKECLDGNLYPLGWFEPGKEGLLNQLSCLADELNGGFYRWREGWAGPFVFPDGRNVPPGPGINAGTAALQYVFSFLYPVEEWREVVGENGFYPFYLSHVGDPFESAIEPIVPQDLSQPTLYLPFEEGVSWSFTGGPHSAIGNWAAWAALDFSPSMSAPGCEPSDEWVVAAADGMVTRTYWAQVVQDISGDGLEQTGWSLLYLHIATRDRVQAGTYLHKGDPIGHPSCEGGFSTGTHLHLARKYNGVWISADGDLPFNMEGWIPHSTGSPYDGTLNRGGTELHACAWWRSCSIASNQGFNKLTDPVAMVSSIPSKFLLMDKE